MEINLSSKLNNKKPKHIKKAKDKIVNLSLRIILYMLGVIWPLSPAILCTPVLASTLEQLIEYFPLDTYRMG